MIGDCEIIGGRIFGIFVKIGKNSLNIYGMLATVKGTEGSVMDPRIGNPGSGVFGGIASDLLLPERARCLYSAWA